MRRAIRVFLAEASRTVSTAREQAGAYYDEFWRLFDSLWSPTR